MCFPIKIGTGYENGYALVASFFLLLSAAEVKKMKSPHGLSDTPFSHKDKMSVLKTLL